MTRTSHRWQSQPGSYDTLHAAQLFPAANAYGVPDLLHTPAGQAPDWMVPYRQRIRAQGPLHDGAVHFFLDDYRFETVWNRPFKALEALRPYTTLLTPDFSLYRDWPLTLQLWNTYRNRWCGRFWQEQGFSVIPTISWSSHASYDFCFLGVPRRSLVAVATVGINLQEPLEYTLFMNGFTEMVRQLTPRLVLSYGPLPPACHELVETKTFPTRWSNIRAARHSADDDKPDKSLRTQGEKDT